MSLWPFFGFSFAIFSLQSILPPTLSTIFIGMSLHTILAPSWLAFAFGLLLWSLLPQRYQRKLCESKILLWLQGFCLCSAVPISFFLIQKLQIKMENSFEQIAKQFANTQKFHELSRSLYESYALPVTFAAAIPFFVYAIYFANVLTRISRSRMTRLLVVEFLGILLGMISTALVLQKTTSWTMALQFGTFIGLCAFARLTLELISNKKIVTGLLLVIFILSIAIIYWIPNLEPVSNPRLSAREFTFSRPWKEIRRSWTSYTRVQTIDRDHKVGAYRVISLGNGIGLAKIPQDKTLDVEDFPLVQIASVFQPKRVLILFAGAGMELLVFKRLLASYEKIVGIEINPEVIRHGLLDPDSSLGDLLKQPNIQLINADARTYLESTSEQFDLIFFSYAGAPSAYYSGAIVHTTQFSMTREAIGLAIKHLRSDGVLLITPGVKLNIIASIRYLERAGEIFNSPTSTVVLTLGPQRFPHMHMWDKELLLWKKNGFMPQDLQRLRSIQRQNFFNIELAPQSKFSPEYNWFYKLLVSPDWEAALYELNQSTNQWYGDFSDDLPFIFRTEKLQNFASPQFWLNSFRDFSWKKIAGSRIHFLEVLLLLSLIAGVAFQFSPNTIDSLPRWQIFLCLGIAYGIGVGTTGIQMALAYTGLLFLGKPTWVLLFLTAVWLGAAALAAYILEKKSLTRRQVLAAILGASCALFIFYLVANSMQFKHTLFQMALPLRVLILTIFIFPLALGFGFLFPSILKQFVSPQNRFQHRLIVMDALGAAFAVVAVPMFVEEIGISRVAYGLALLTFCSGVCFLFLCRKQST